MRFKWGKNHEIWLVPWVPPSKHTLIICICDAGIADWNLLLSIWTQNVGGLKVVHHLFWEQIISIFHNLSHKLKAEGILPNSFSKTCVILITKRQAIILTGEKLHASLATPKTRQGHCLLLSLFNIEAKAIQERKDGLLNKRCWNNWHPHAK